MFSVPSVVHSSAFSRPPSAKAAYRPAQRGATERNVFLFAAPLTSPQARSSRKMLKQSETFSPCTQTADSADGTVRNEMKHFACPPPPPCPNVPLSDSPIVPRSHDRAVRAELPVVYDDSPAHDEMGRPHVRQIARQAPRLDVFPRTSRERPIGNPAEINDGFPV
jgi:hypothetical protein